MERVTQAKWVHLFFPPRNGISVHDFTSQSCKNWQPLKSKLWDLKMPSWCHIINAKGYAEKNDPKCEWSKLKSFFVCTAWNYFILIMAWFSDSPLQCAWNLEKYFCVAFFINQVVSVHESKAYLFLISCILKMCVKYFLANSYNLEKTYKKCFNELSWPIHVSALYNWSWKNINRSICLERHFETYKRHPWT